MDLRLSERALAVAHRVEGDGAAVGHEHVGDRVVATAAACQAGAVPGVDHIDIVEVGNIQRCEMENGVRAVRRAARSARRRTRGRRARVR